MIPAREIGVAGAGLAASAAGWNLVGYPALLSLLARRAGPSRGGGGTSAAPPFSVSVLLAAYNEADRIEERVRDLLSQDRVTEVLAASDGSTDGTDGILRDLAASLSRVRFFPRPRSGKVAALRALAREAKGDVFVVTDANTHFAPGAVAALVACLGESGVGAACGDLRLAPRTAAGEGEAAYWSYETAIKRNASRAGLLLMGAGAIYAVRRADWEVIENTLPIPDDFADDSYVPLYLAIRGRRNRFVPEAVAHEDATGDFVSEFRRRVRMVEQDARLASRLPLGENPRVALAFVSQKVLRWLLFPLGLATCGGLLLAGLPHPILAGAAVLILEPMFLGTRRGFYLVFATAAASLGFVHGIRGRSRAVWSPSR